MTEKEKEQVEHYQKHKTEIDKKDNDDFIKFLKGIGILLVIIILFCIIISIKG